jgi:hypothetical protein
MRAVLSILALAATALTANIPFRKDRGLVGRTYGHGSGGGGHGGGGGGGGEYGGGGGGGGEYGGGGGGHGGSGGGGGYGGGGGGGKDDDCETVTTKVIATYTTLCPVTETHTEPGNTYTTTYTTTSTVKTTVPTTIVITKTAPPVTKSTDKGKATLTH